MDGRMVKGRQNKVGWRIFPSPGSPSRRLILMLARFSVCGGGGHACVLGREVDVGDGGGLSGAGDGWDGADEMSHLSFYLLLLWLLSLGMVKA